MQALVDLSIGLSDLLAKLTFALGEFLLVKIFLDVFAHLSADRAIGHHFGLNGFGNNRRRRLNNDGLGHSGGLTLRRATHERLDLIGHVGHDRTRWKRPLIRRRNLPNLCQQSADHRNDEDQDEYGELDHFACVECGK
jgi:hypothetical protein